ncbi:hypothetical protein RI129_010226 [Pyrocoelia pectoralis]|uniref:Uncharacterized protein n=1 Tax=Pyrocoelia pectoralis TaxID=417401 RepID=A0AAN7V8T2_9COLE
MCLNNYATTTTTKLKSPRSPWRQILRQPIKPRLSRKIIKSARVNLNCYWSKFEELSNGRGEISSTDNEINENIFNELKDRQCP